MTFTQFRDFEKLRFTKKLDRTQNRGEPLGGGCPPIRKGCYEKANRREDIKNFEKLRETEKATFPPSVLRGFGGAPQLEVTRWGLRLSWCCGGFSLLLTVR